MTYYRNPNLVERIKEALKNTKPARPGTVEAGAQVKAGTVKGGNMYERFAERMLSETGTRPDLQIVDWKRLDRNSAVVLMAYNPALGDPTREEVFAYLERAFPGHRVLLEEETARKVTVANVNAYQFVIRRVVPTRPFDDAQTMRKVTASAYLDTELGEIWQIEERDGRKFLAKVAEEDIDAIVSREVEKIKNPVRASLRDIYAGVVFGRGDKVRFYYDGKTMIGEVTRIDDATGEVTVKVAGNKTYNVPKEAIFYVIELGSGTKQQLSQTVKQYYKTLYGEEMADELTKRFK